MSHLTDRYTTGIITFVMRYIKKPFIVLILTVTLILYGCSACESPSAEIIGEWEMGEGFIYITDACAGEIGGKPYLFVMTQRQGGAAAKATIHVIDIDNPVEPVEVASLETPIETIIQFGGLALSGMELYVAFTGADEAALWVLDVSDPESPHELTLMDTMYAMWKLSISGNTLAVATALTGGHFAFFDISRPSQPRELAELALAHRLEGRVSYWHVDYVGSMFYVVDRDGLVIVDASSPATPREVDFYANPDWEPVETEGVEGWETKGITAEGLMDDVAPSGSYLDIAVSGDYAYIAASDSGLVVLDISEPTSPREVARLDVPDRPRRVIISGNLVFLMGFRVPDDETLNGPSYWMHPLHIVDITNPVAPRLVESIEEITGIIPSQSMVTLGDYVYFLNNQTVYIIDIYGGCR
jgi:hypothetical protein